MEDMNLVFCLKTTYFIEIINVEEKFSKDFGGEVAKSNF